MQDPAMVNGDGIHRLDTRRVLSARGNVERQNPDDTPQDEAVDLIQRFRQLSEDSEIRTKAMRWWQQCDRFLEGDQWGEVGSQLKPWQAKLVINKLHKVREKWVSLLMQNLPKAEFIARDAAHTLVADALDGFFAHEWERNGWTTTVGMVLKQVLSHGIGWIKVYWDVHGDGGRGTVKLEPVSNYDLFLDENAVIRDGKLVCKWAIHRFEMTRLDVISTYESDPGGSIQEEEHPATNENGMPVKPKKKFFQYVDDLNVGGSTRGSGGTAGGDLSERHPDHAYKKDVFTLNECLYFDDTRVEGPEVDNAAGQVPPLKYPNGRVMTECNGKLMYDDANRLGFNMYVPFCLSPNVERIYTPSIIYHCISPQEELNKRRSQIADHAALASNPILVVSNTSQVDQSFVPSPGEVLVSQDQHLADGGIRWLAPPQVSPEVIQSSANAEHDIDNISGIDEIYRGQIPNQLESGVALDKLQDSAETVPQMHTMFLDDNIKTLMRNIASCFLDFVSDDRKFRFLDTRTLEHQYGDFNPTNLILPSREDAVVAVQQEINIFQEQLIDAQLQLSEAEVAELLTYVKPEIEARLAKIEQIWQLPASDLVSFDVALQTGTRDLTQLALQSLVMQMNELGFLVPASVMELLKFPNWEHHLKLSQQAAEAQAAAEAEQMEEQVAMEREIDEDEHEQELEVETLKGEFRLTEAEIKARAQRAAAQQRKSQQGGTSK